MAQEFKYPVAEYKEEDIVSIPDGNGGVVEFVECDGHCLPLNGLKRGLWPDPRVHFKRLREWELRSDDVLMCAYPKSGTHWMSEIVYMLRKQEAEYDANPKEKYMLEFNTPETMDEHPSPRNLNSHLRFELLPRQILQGKCKIIFIQRNPKDIVVSYMHHCKGGPAKFQGTFDQFLKIFMSKTILHEPWLKYTIHCEKFIKDHPEVPVQKIFFEDLKKNPEAEIRKLAQFLSCEASDELVAKISEKCAFDKLKQANDTVKNAAKFSKMYRKGEVGDWKNYFTVAQSEMFDEFLEQKMKDSETIYKYEI